VTDTIYTVQVPGIPNANDGLTQNLGTVFTPAVNGTVTHIRWYFPTTLPGGTVTGGLWTWTSDAAGTLLSSAPFTAPVAGTWNTAQLPAPVAVTAGSYYVTSIYSPDFYVATAAQFNGVSITNGNLTAPADDAVTPRRNGKFLQAAAGLTYPTSFFNGNGYFADVLFEPTTAQTVTPDSLTLPLTFGAPTLTDSSMSVSPGSLNLPLTFGAPTVTGSITPPPLVTINLAAPNFAAIVTGIGACVVDALDQTPAGAPCRQCLLLPTAQIPWDNCGPCDQDQCQGQIALAIRSVYGSEAFPQPATGKTWGKCSPHYWIARVVVSVTRCLPTMDDAGEPPTCAAELAAAVILEQDRLAVRQGIACCLDAMRIETPGRTAAWLIDASNTVGESGGCGGSETEFLIGVQTCPCPG
jgi:hypothetical protein